ncbi:MAG TPA: pyruvate kinase, partial [Bacteroidales bacterium]|nr:pyruvate kinase [Bacteroidales bacterium]
MNKGSIRRTKIIATIGPASSTPEMIRKLIEAGMDVARLNFSHGDYDRHREVIGWLRSVSQGMQRPVTIIMDLQGPKIRVGTLPEGKTELIAGTMVTLVPVGYPESGPGMIPIDYSFLASEARPGMQVLIADGLMELEVVDVTGNRVNCRVKEGGLLTDHKGVNFPNLDLRLPSLTEKDLRDLDFGLNEGVDWVSLSFVRSAKDIRALCGIIASKGLNTPVIAKIEKPQAVDHLEEIVEAADGIMVARGDLGVEMSPDRVPMIQKRIITLCNRAGKPVITATQMLESMIRDPRPTRAEASDVANAVIDGTDAVMLSGETAMGAWPVKSVEMMDRIARDVESELGGFDKFPPIGTSDLIALCRAANHMGAIIRPSSIVVLTHSGHSATCIA